MTTKAARTAVIQAVRDHESAWRLHDLAHLDERLFVLAEQTMDVNPNMYPVNSFKRWLAYRDSQYPICAGAGDHATEEVSSSGCGERPRLTDALLSPYGPGRWCPSWRSARLPPAILHQVPMRLIGLVLALAVNLVLAPLATEAQPEGKVYRIGYLTPFAFPNALHEDFRQSLRDLGYVEGRNIVIETRSVEQRYGDLPKLAAELVTPMSMSS